MLSVNLLTRKRKASEDVFDTSIKRRKQERENLLPISHINTRKQKANEEIFKKSAKRLKQDRQKEPLISHIKAHIDLKGLQSSIYNLKGALKQKECVRRQNFSIVRERFTYMIYEDRGYVNVANIKHWEELLDVLPVFCTSFNIDITKLPADRLQVDNITASGSFFKRIDLIQLNSYFNNKPPSSQFPLTVCQFWRKRFPAVFLKTRQSGTVIVHNSGCYCIVGAKNLENLSSIYKWICAFICEL